MAQLLQIIPCSQPTWAVFADLEGKPDFRVVTCVGLAEAKVPEAGGRYHMERMPCGVAIFPGGHMQMADAAQEFLGYSTDTDPAPWEQRAATRRANLIKEAAEQSAKAAVNKQIIVPNQKIVRAHEVPPKAN